MIRLSGIGKRFEDPVLLDIDLHIPEGCLYGLMGPGASGKSVLVKLIAGLMRPDVGTVEVDGHELTAMPEIALQELRKRIGMQFQNNALFDFMTVGENIAFPLRRLFDMDESEIADRVAAGLDRMSLSGFQDREPSELSGGQKRRVGLARATVATPPIALYDEPAAGLDPVTSQRIFDLLRAEQRSTKSTALMVSSDVDRLLSVADRVGLMVNGRIVFDGTTDEARTSENPFVKQFIHGLEEGPL